jgi:Bacteriophage T4-like portal protein (Gp20)
MADNSVFGRLKKLFSTNTVVRNVGGKRLKVADTDNIQSFINRRGIDRYHRVYSSMTGGYGSSHGRYEAAAAFQGSRLQLFRDYDMMDNDPIISSVMDIYADESTVKDEFGNILTIHSKNTQIQEILHNLFYDVLNVEFNLWPWVRNMVKYGDFFLFLDIDPEYGVVNVLPLSVYETIRIEGQDPGNPFSVKFKIENDFLSLGKTEFDNYEIAHFRLLSDTNFLPYGKAMVEGGRRVWKQLQLMEDAMLIHRIMRAPDKRKILVDIGNIPPAEIDTFMGRIMDRMKKTPLVDPATGDYNLRYNMMNIVEDFYMPVRGKDSGTDIQNLPGLQFNAIEDIEYLRNKLMAAFKVPKAFLGYEEDLSGKATLAAQDVRFARTIERIQRIMVSELTKIAIIHLYVQGFTDEELIDFELSLTNPSVIYEQEKLNLWKEKIGVAEQIAGSKLLSQDWIYHNILELSSDEISEERKKIADDMKRVSELNAIEQGGAQQGAAQPGEQQTEQPATDEAPPSEEEEQQVSDVDSILSSLEDGGEESELEGYGDEEAELEEAKMGRPKEGMKFGQDSHPRGRDPLGHKENKAALTVGKQRNDKKKSPLALTKEVQALMASLKKPSKKVLMENQEVTGSLLDESNILDLEN